MRIQWLVWSRAETVRLLWYVSISAFVIAWSFATVGCHRSSGEKEGTSADHHGGMAGPSGGHRSGSERARPTTRSQSRPGGRVTSGPSGPQSVFIDHEPLPPVEKVLAEIRRARELKGKVSSSALISAVMPKLRRWSDLLVSYSEQNKRREADLIAAALVELQHHWGDDLFPPSKFDAFVRDRFEVKKRVVFVAQFFRPMVYHKNAQGVFSKHYRFSVYVKGKIVVRYYLESLKPPRGPEKFVLAKLVRGKHLQVADLATKRPDYWQVRKLVEQDVAKAVAAGRLPLQQ